eukprot:CAMPEP_0113571358 /NCGR_PEP_ID=MMETSP0015_2-20120614/25510_1 /TAXON_ID=2838 /ORGANISM="Odontella" /LENGTH=344 /DNA_ID=CAMNT_0000474301 /DNA_START=15 /DNA_END=1049 /DNA_ORIENTATION=+ /assembly_acc=CAM_ASM_000160
MTNASKKALLLAAAAALLATESSALAPLRGRSAATAAPRSPFGGACRIAPPADPVFSSSASVRWTSPPTALSSAAAASPGEQSGDDAPPAPVVPTPAPPAKLNKASKRLISALSFLTGWADVALITKYQTFATMMTGNTMKMAGAIIDRNPSGVVYFASAIASYVLGLIAFRKSDLALKDKSLSRVCAPLVAGLFILSDYLSYIHPGNKLIPVSLLSAAFAIINSVGSEVGGTMTFVLTGHMTKLTALGVDRVSRAAGRKKLTGGDTSAAARSSMVIGMFFAGALGACGLNARVPELMRRGGFAALGVLYGAVFLWQDRENLGRWWMREDEHMCEIDALETTCS